VSALGSAPPEPLTVAVKEKRDAPLPPVQASVYSAGAGHPSAQVGISEGTNLVPEQTASIKI